jgi:2-dehydro-3-deoxygluconokinase
MANKSLSVLPATEARYDVVSLGEVMLRLDPGDRRIRTTRTFDAWEGGGEYNVARGLRRVFGMRAAVVTALVDNEVGRLIEDFILTGGVDTSWIQWREYDGIGRTVRNGLNFTERGFGVRGAVGMYDRGNTAVAQMQPEDVDWDDLFSHGVRWFHTGGIFAGLSPSAVEVAETAMKAARAHEAIVSYDLNYRPSQWKDAGGLQRALEVNRRLAEHTDVMIGVLVGQDGEYTASLGFEGVDASLTDPDTAAFRSMIEQAAAAYPNLQVIATTLREVTSASVNDWGALAWSRSEGFVEATRRTGLAILDRIGGGDAFVSGLAYGLMKLETLADAVEYGAAHGALAMTTPGDTSMATLAEVAKLASGGSARVQR